MGDLLGADYALVEKNALYRCLDKVLPYKAELFGHLRQRWQDLFGARFDVLLYDLTSTYFESDPPADEADKRRHGYSRDKRSDCVQVVIALIVTPEGFPLAYEVLPGNTAGQRDVARFLAQDRGPVRHGGAHLGDGRGIPTEEALAEMRQADPPVSYLVGTPKGRLGTLEQAVLGLPWQEVRDGVEVKLLPQDPDLYVSAQSRSRIHKERAMRRRQLKRLWRRLGQLAAMRLKREDLLMKLGAARAKAPGAWRLLDVAIDPKEAAFSYQLNRGKLRQVRRREGRYLLRTNLSGKDPAQLWRFYIQLVEIEAAFKALKDDLGLRPIYHQLEQRIEAHIFIAFLAYCLHVTLRARTPPARRRAHPESRARQACRHPDARRPLPDHRRAHADPHPLHRAQRRPTGSPRSAQPDVAAPASTAHHRSRPHGRARLPDVVETFRPEAPFCGASHARRAEALTPRPGLGQSLAPNACARIWLLTSPASLIAASAH